VLFYHDAVINRLIRDGTILEKYNNAIVPVLASNINWAIKGSVQPAAGDNRLFKG